MGGGVGRLVRKLESVSPALGGIPNRPPHKGVDAVGFFAFPSRTMARGGKRDRRRRRGRHAQFARWLVRFYFRQISDGVKLCRAQERVIGSPGQPIGGGADK